MQVVVCCLGAKIVKCARRTLRSVHCCTIVVIVGKFSICFCYYIVPISAFLFFCIAEMLGSCSCETFLSLYGMFLKFLCCQSFSIIFYQ